MTALMYNPKNDQLLSIEKGLWFEDKDDSSPLYGVKMDSVIGAFFTDDEFEDIYDAAKRRGYIKIGVL